MQEKRTAIVTGGARGIGAAIARKLAADGRRVAVIDLSEPDTADVVDAIRAAGGDAIGVGADVADAAAVADAVKRIVDDFGTPTILVNNAGILRDNLLFKMSEEDWDSVMNVHFRGAFLMTRAVQSHQVPARLGPHRQPFKYLGAR